VGAPARARLGDTARETLRRFQAGEQPETIAAGRSLSMGTVYGHLADAMGVGEQIDLRRLLQPAQESEIRAAFATAGTGTLSPVFELLAGRYDYGRLRLVRALLERESKRLRPADTITRRALES
jgi:ATP-dependent DNA helicase RecQ